MGNGSCRIAERTQKGAAETVPFCVGNQNRCRCADMPQNLYARYSKRHVTFGIPDYAPQKYADNRYMYDCAGRNVCSMKILRNLLMAACVICMLSGGLSAYAEENIYENKVTVIMDGEEVDSDVPAMIIDDRTMLPFRAILEKFGADVDWNAEYEIITAIKAETILMMRIDKPIMVKTNLVDGVTEQIELDVVPQIVDDRSLVPVRAVSEALDAQVDWDAETRTVTIDSRGEE